MLPRYSGGNVEGPHGAKAKKVEEERGGNLLPLLLRKREFSVRWVSGWGRLIITSSGQGARESDTGSREPGG